MNSDPRFLRSQEKLHEAALTLAEDLPIEKITITAIAKLAGVHRSTFYEHADSVASLLRQAIYKELDELYYKHGVGARPDATLEESVRVIINYLESREGLFSRMNNETGAMIRDILRAHFTRSLNTIINKNNLVFPETKTQISIESMKRFTAYSMADMHVGMYAAALQMRKPRPPELLAEMIRITSPKWWRWE